MTWLVLRYWYRYHLSKFHKWDYRKSRIKRKRSTKIYRQRYVRRVWTNCEYHRFWVHNYGELIGAYGHDIECIHFGQGENTVQSGNCPYAESICATCNQKIYLGRYDRTWHHYLSYEDDGFTPHSHVPVPTATSDPYK